MVLHALARQVQYRGEPFSSRSFAMGTHWVKRIGPASVVAGIGAWAVYAAALIVGGIDSSGSIGPLALVYLALVLAASSLVLSLVGLIRGPQRAFAALGLLAPTIFALHWIGVLRI